MEQVDDLGKITIVKNGKEVDCDILFTFENEELNRVYIGYSDHSIAKNGRENIYIGYYDTMIGTGELENITDQKELEMVQKVLEKIAND